MSSYNPSGAPAKKKSPVVWIILGIIVLFVLPSIVCVGCCGGLGMMGMNMILSSPPYVNSLERLKSNPEVIAKLGEPIETDGMPTMMNFNDAGGTADFSFRVKGPKGGASVSFNAVKQNEAWRYNTFNVSFDDGSTISLADDAAATGDATNEVSSEPPTGDGAAESTDAATDGDTDGAAGDEEMTDDESSESSEDADAGTEESAEESTDESTDETAEGETAEGDTTNESP